MKEMKCRESSDRDGEKHIQNTRLKDNASTNFSRLGVCQISPNQTNNAL